jgi:hypothetical protein
MTAWTARDFDKCDDGLLAFDNFPVHAKFDWL